MAFTVLKTSFLTKKTLPELCQKPLKNTKIKNQKPLSGYQKQRLAVAIEALNNPIFSTW
jgi:ABC-type lipoprotein export system ATPase subunit